MIVKNTVSRDDSIYEAWPDLVMTESGKLICIFSECTHHVDREAARLMLTESYDRGHTWTAKHPLTEKGTAKNFFNFLAIFRSPLKLKVKSKHWRPGCHGLAALDPTALRPALSDGLPFDGISVCLLGFCVFAPSLLQQSRGLSE